MKPSSALLSICFLLFTYLLNAQTQAKPQDTEVWSPLPKIVTVGKTSVDPPSDAMILFDGKNLDEWVLTNNPAKSADWLVGENMFMVNKKSGNIQTRKTFLDYQLHLEWLVPADIDGAGQGRGNSGVFLASLGGGDAGYEIQIMDSYNNPTYVNGQCGSIYKQFAPLVNATKKPGEWQTYDIIWNAPRFSDNGTLQVPAHVTVIQNGILVQNYSELKGVTTYLGQPIYKAHGRSPIKLQAHGDKSKPLSFRNIWVREL